MNLINEIEKNENDTRLTEGKANEMIYVLSGAGTHEARQKDRNDLKKYKKVQQKTSKDDIQ